MFMSDKAESQIIVMHETFYCFFIFTSIGLKRMALPKKCLEKINKKNDRK